MKALALSLIFMMTSLTVISLAAPTLKKPEPKPVAKTTCQTLKEARKKYPEGHLYWHGSGHCWNDVAVHKGRLKLLAEHKKQITKESVPIPLVRDALAFAPAPKLIFAVKEKPAKPKAKTLHFDDDVIFDHTTITVQQLLHDIQYDANKLPAAPSNEWSWAYSLLIGDGIIMVAGARINVAR